jgi:hypothetical protein
MACSGQCCTRCEGDDALWVGTCCLPANRRDRSFVHTLRRGRRLPPAGRIRRRLGHVRAAVRQERPGQEADSGDSGRPESRRDSGHDTATAADESGLSTGSHGRSSDPGRVTGAGEAYLLRRDRCLFGPDQYGRDRYGRDLCSRSTADRSASDGVTPDPPGGPDPPTVTRARRVADEYRSRDDEPDTPAPDLAPTANVHARTQRHQHTAGPRGLAPATSITDAPATAADTTKPTHARSEPSRLTNRRPPHRGARGGSAPAASITDA